MEFKQLLKLFDESDPALNRKLYRDIQELLRIKTMTNEKDLHLPIPSITDFIQEELVYQKQLLAEMNDIFCEIIGHA